MYVDITTALAGIKTMTEFAAQAAKSKTDSAIAEKAVELNAIIIDMQTAILHVQAQNQVLLQRNHELEKQIADIENWKATIEKYNLIEIASGVFVYAINQDQRENQPSHWLCAHCYQNKQKSILQCEGTGIDGTDYLCPRCKTVIHDPSKYIPISFG